MTTRVILLRGINVGAGTSLPMETFRAAILATGALDAQTYIQSGNAVCRWDGKDEVLAERLSQALVLPNGSHPAVLVLTAEALAGMLSANPFPEAASAPKSLHIFFADRELSPDPALLAAAAPDERHAAIGRAFYLYAPSGFGRSKLAASVERALRPARVTARNLATVMALDALARGLA